MTEEKTIPYIAHESEVARLERIIKRLWILCIIIFLAFVISNGAWIWYENQWEDVSVSQEITQDSGEGGTNTYSGNVIGGDFYSDTENQDNGEETLEKN